MTPTPTPITFTRGHVAYLWLAGIFVTCLLIANITGSKFFDFGTVSLLGYAITIEHSVGMLAFPVTFILTDLLNEYYGPKGARRVAFLGLGMSLLASVLLLAATHAPPSSPKPWTVDEPSFDRVFAASGVMIVASMVAYMVGQFVDIATFQVFKRLTGGKMVWLRATGSTIISQAVDSLAIMTVLTLASKDPDWGLALIAAAKGYVIKFGLAVLTTPFIYLGRRVLQQVTGMQPLPAAPR